MRARPGLTDLAGTYAATLLMQASTLVVGVILARALGPEARGTLAAALIWPTMVAALALLGTNNRIALEAAEAEGAGEGPALARRVVGFAFACAAGALAVGYLAMPWLVPAQQPAVLELSRLFLLFAPASILLALLKGMDLGEGRLRRFNVTSCVLNLGHLALVVVVWLAGAREPTPFLLCLLLANYAALAFRILRAGPRALAPRLDLAWARGLVVRAAPYLATAIAVLAHAQADRVFLLWYLDAAALGLYTVALSSASVHMGLGQSVARLIFSRATRADAGEAMVDIARLFRLGALACLALSLAMVAAIPVLIPFLFGERFAPAVGPAMLLVAGSTCGGLAGMLDEGLRGRANPLSGLVGHLLSACVFLALLAFGLIPATLLGVASAHCIAQAAFLLWMIASFRARSSEPLVPRRSDLGEFLVHGRRLAHAARRSA